MVIIYAETWNKKFKKTTFEAVNYGARCSKEIGTEAIAVVFGECDSHLADLGNHGADRIIHIQGIEQFEPFSFATVLSDIAKEFNGKLIIVNGTANGKSLIGVMSSLLSSSAISNVIELPVNYEPINVHRSAFSSKGIEKCSSKSNCTILGIVPNSIGIISLEDIESIIEVRNIISKGKTIFGESQNESGNVPLPEAERVVSAGRGMKGPENWGIITELAEVLNAGTACSKPVSDIGWRPHSEHVGQTGIQINPQLYIAIGISGAIQHLAGVSRSKTIVVINNDPEAPFFKAADYGIIGDAFDVVPRLTEAIKSFQK